MFVRPRAHFHPDPPAPPVPPAGDPPAGDPPAPPAEKLVPQSQVNLIVEQRLAQDRERRKAEADAEKRRIEAEAAAKNGEWEKVAKTHESTISEKDAEIARLTAEIANRDKAATRTKVGAEAKLPPELWGRILGETEDEMRADAKELAKTVAPPAAHRIDPGRAGGGNGGGTPDQKQALKRSGRY